ncbi:MAG: M28 family peptidase [bacterium]|nr:M28 family peptidase [bacterium]
MKKYPVLVFVFVFVSTLIFTLPVHGDGGYVHHDLIVKISPAKRWIEVKDSITLPGSFFKGKDRANSKVHFLLHGNLKITSASSFTKIKEEHGVLKADFFGINTAQFKISKKIPIKHYSIEFTGDSMVSSFFILYEGEIHHPTVKAGAEYARGFSETPGIISAQGVYLAGSSFWSPWFNDHLVTFQMDCSVPADWATVSQGDRSLHKKNGVSRSVWVSKEPMDEVYLVAAKFEEYGLNVDNVKVMAFLRSSDAGLANKYLETTGQYLKLYEKLIGPYPYSKFALIENFWETGYGMPSFTLLGEKVIRFPFILHSSYPHELLHNWWGNSVFVDYVSGNWCEGLTVYLADHLIKQQRRQGASYRKTTLQGYTHYSAGKKEEFPLSGFKARYNALSSSIGYGKSMMMFHMLRLMVGDKVFIKAIGHFYKENKFKRASFEDIRVSFEKVSGKDLKAFFQQWVQRVGVPELRLGNSKVEKKGDGYVLRFSLDQVQPDMPYVVNVPVAVLLEGEKEARIKLLVCKEKQNPFEFTFKRKPLAVDVDPGFDVFRKLHINEIPPTLSSAFGADAVLILLPSKASPAFLKGYRSLADSWAKESGGKIVIKLDTDFSVLPSDKAIWLMGWENIHKGVMSDGLSGFPVSFNPVGVKIVKKILAASGNSIIIASKNSKNPSLPVVLLSSDRVAALPGLGRKLPHYGKYSYLAFEGDEPVNHSKGQWPAVNSPMSVAFAPDFSMGTLKESLPKEAPLAQLAPLFSAQRMMKHVNYLASEDLEGRGLGYKGLEKAAHYIAVAFRNAGLVPAGDGNSYFQSWEGSTKDGRPILLPLRNVIGLIPGSDPGLKSKPVVICAHYDPLGLGAGGRSSGKIHFGADDNASGVAVLVELAHVLGKSLKPLRPILFIAFTGEESGLLGSSYFVKNCKKVSLDVFAAVNLDTVGRLEEGEKLMVIGGSSAKEWKFIFMGIGYTIGVESQLISQDLDSSDQVSFIRAGIPGIQLFSGPHGDYHRPGDTADKIIAPGLVKVAGVAKEALVYLAARKEALSVKGAVARPAAKKGQGGRRVRTGIMPDFSFSGKGVRVGMVSESSPAFRAGFKKGDTIIRVGAVEVGSLREYAGALKAYSPGDSVVLEFLRDGESHSVSVSLEAR